MKLLIVPLFAGALLFSTFQGASAQGIPAEYERARLVGKRFEGKVFRAKVTPHWLQGGDAFWLSNDLSEGRREFLLVDALTAQVGPAFDHQRLATALVKILGREVDAQRLPLERLEFDSGRRNLRFGFGGKAWNCDLRTYEVQPATAQAPVALASNRTLHPSESSDQETFITFVNRTAAEADCFWIDQQGEKKRYLSLKPGETQRQQTFVGHVWLVAAKDGKTLGVFEGGVQPAEAVIAPAGERTAKAPPKTRAAGTKPQWDVFVKDSNLFATNRQTKQELQLSKNGTPEDCYSGPFVWSPDGTKVVAVQVRQGDDRKIRLVESSPKDRLQPKTHELSYAKAGDAIDQEMPRLFDLTTGSQIPLSSGSFANPWSISELRWAADSSRFTFLYNQRGHQVLRLVSVDAASGSTSALVDEKSATFIDYSQKTYLHWLEASNELIWMSERDGWNHLWLCDGLTGAVKNQITKGAWVVRKVERVDAARRQIWLTVAGIQPGIDPYYLQLARVNFDGTGLTLLTEGDGTHRWEFSPDGRWLLDSWSRVDMPPMTVLRDAESGQLICPIQQGDIQSLLATGWTAPERFAAKGRDGNTEIFGIIIRPPNFDPHKKYPVLERIYAGPHDAFVPKEWGLQSQQRGMAELGFIVVQIDGMGTNWRSRAFHDVCWKNLKDAGFPDRIAWMQAAAARHPEMDLSRVGIYGGSAGGQSALGALLFHGDFYKAAAADCGCHDNRMDKIWWNEAWMGWPVGPEYADNSNVTHAHQLTGKLLLTFGELDNNVDPSSSMQVVNALIQANKDFEMLVVPGAGHGIGEAPYPARRRMDFFVRQLLR